MTGNAIASWVGANSVLMIHGSFCVSAYIRDISAVETLAVECYAPANEGATPLSQPAR